MSEPKPARVLACCAGKASVFTYQGRRIRTGIFKSAIEGPVAVRRLGLEGDQQADKRVHGGERKAVYFYPYEHYADWQADLEIASLPYGSFGENVTVSGLLETDVHKGDVLRIGSAVFCVQSPRLPCYKLAAKFDRPGIIRRLYESGRCGFYTSVEQEGVMQAGDVVTIVESFPGNPTIREALRLRTPAPEEL